jgi:flagellar protein FlaG
MLNDIVNSGIPSTAKVRDSNPAPAQQVEAEPKVAEQAPPERQQLQAAVSALNDYVQNVQRTLSFSIEQNTGITVVKVFDTETEELIRQIPLEETIKLAESIEANSGSLLLKEQA